MLSRSASEPLKDWEQWSDSSSGVLKQVEVSNLLVLDQQQRILAFLAHVVVEKWREAGMVVERL